MKPSFYMYEFFLRVIIIISIISILLKLKKIINVKDDRSYIYFFTAFLILLSQHVFMTFIKFMGVFMGVKPPEPYFPVLDHTLETLFFIFFLTAAIRFSMPTLKKSIVNIVLYINIALLAAMGFIIFFSYVNSYELGIKFGNHWGDLFFEAWHIIILETLIFIFSFAYLIKKGKVFILLLIAFLLWFMGHAGHIINLAVADNYFTPLKWVEWPFTTISIITLFFIFRYLHSTETIRANG